jgi:transcriptional regulator with XRE-family HTH domain
MKLMAVNERRFVERLRVITEIADGPKALAYHLGVSLSTVYNYMNGRIPTFEIMTRLARYAGVSIEWFLMEDADAERVTLRPGSMSFAERQSTAPLKRTGTY